MIEGYFGRETIVVGEQLKIHISTDSASFRVDFYRIGAVNELAGSTEWYSGRQAPAPPHPDSIAGHASPAVDWNWPTYEFTPSPDWNPGVYVAVFVESQNPTCDIDPLEDFGRAFFVLRPRIPGHATILYKISSFTRHAYNRADGPHIERASSLYDHPVYIPGHDGGRAGHAVSMHRPGRLFELSYWDAPFISWLERAGYEVEFCTDLDLHLDPGLLQGYRLLLSVGHDEYWTGAMREHAERFVDDGGNVAFFSANTCWWRTHVTDNGTTLVVDTDHRVGNVYPHLPATDRWWTPKPDGVGMPENTLTGVSFRNGGMWPTEGPWPGGRPRTGFTVQHTDHWIYEGTGLREGRDGGQADALGAGLPLIGYECDGAAFYYDDDGLARPTGKDGTPKTFLILGIMVLDPVHEDIYDLWMGHWNCAAREPVITGSRAATMGIYTRNGTVFTAATTDWPVIVGQESDPAIDRVTRNILDQLSR